MSFINLSIAEVTFDVSTHEDSVVVRGYRGHYPSICIHIPREAARRLAADLIEAAESLSPTPPDPTAATLPAAGGDFSSEVAS